MSQVLDSGIYSEILWSQIGILREMEIFGDIRGAKPKSTTDIPD